MAGFGAHPADFLQRFEGRLQTPAGERPVVTVLDLAGLRLEGPPPGSDLLGSFPFTQITQWETGLTEVFSFTVRTDGGAEQTINVRSSPANVQGIQAGVEAKVGRIMELKNAGANVAALRSPEHPAAPVLPMEDPALRGGMMGAGMAPGGGMMAGVSGMGGGMGMFGGGMGAPGIPGGGMGMANMPGIAGLPGFGGSGMLPPQSWQAQPAAAAAPVPVPAPPPAVAAAPTVAAPAASNPPAKRHPSPPRRVAPTPPSSELVAGRRGEDSDRKGRTSARTPVGAAAAPSEGRKGRGAGAPGKGGKLKAVVEGSIAVRRFKKGGRGKGTKLKEPEGPEELQRALQETREYAHRMKEAVASRDRELVELRQHRSFEATSKERMLDSLHAQEGELETLKKGVLSLSTADRSPPLTGPLQGYTKGKRFPWEASMGSRDAEELLGSRRFSPRSGPDAGPRDDLLAENNALKAQIGRLMADGSQDYQMEAAELRAANSELRQHNHDLDRQIKDSQNHSLVDKLKTALFTTEQEVVQLQERIGQLEDEAGKQQATVATQERALQEYEAAMAQSVASPFLGGVGARMSPGGLEAAGSGQAGDPLGQLRELMGEAYLLKMALRKEDPDAEQSTILRALDKWIMASHSLKKACMEKPSAASEVGVGAWGGLGAQGS